MRVTKAMKDYVAKQLDEKRVKANKEFSKAYEERRKQACKEIEQLMETVYPKIDLILEKYNMSTKIENSRYCSEKEYSKEIVKSVYDVAIRNEEEFDKIRDYEHKNYIKQQEMIERFILECDLGIDKEEFFKKVEEMSF